MLDGDPPRVDVELREEVGDGQRTAELEPIAIQHYDHRRIAGCAGWQDCRKGRNEGPFGLAFLQFCHPAILQFLEGDLIAIDIGPPDR